MIFYAVLLYTLKIVHNENSKYEKVNFNYQDDALN